MSQQGVFTRGIFQFDDPSGCLMAVRMPQAGAAALYSGTRILVKPNQRALFLYNEKIAETLGPGNHEVKTENFPILSQLANWRFGFESPLECEIWFFSGNVFTGRRWGTKQPVLLALQGMGSLPVRAYGNYTIEISDPKRFYLELVGGKASYDVSESDEFVQGQLLELLPKAMSLVKDAKDLSTKQDDVSEQLEELLGQKLAPYGLKVVQVQVLSMQPPKEVLEALDEKAAMDVIGDKREYLLYKMAHGLEHMQSAPGGTDPTSLMMTMLMSKNLVGSVDFREKEKLAAQSAPPLTQSKCPACHGPLPAGSRFCPACGNKVQP